MPAGKPYTPIAASSPELLRLTGGDLKVTAAGRGKAAKEAQAEIDRRKHNKALRKEGRS